MGNACRDRKSGRQSNLIFEVSFYPSQPQPLDQIKIHTKSPNLHGPFWPLQNQPFSSLLRGLVSIIYWHTTNHPMFCGFKQVLYHVCIIVSCGSRVDGALWSGLPTWILWHTVAVRWQMRLESCKLQTQLVNYNGLTAYLQYIISSPAQQWNCSVTTQHFSPNMLSPCGQLGFLTMKNLWVVPLLWWSWLPLRNLAKWTRLLPVLGCEVEEFPPLFSQPRFKGCSPHGSDFTGEGTIFGEQLPQAQASQVILASHVLEDV